MSDTVSIRETDRSNEVVLYPLFTEVAVRDGSFVYKRDRFLDIGVEQVYLNDR